MNDERLLEVIEAFRGEHGSDALDTAAIRRRVLASCVRQPKRRPRLAWLLPAAVLLVGSAALAANGTAPPTLGRMLAWLGRGAPSADGSRGSVTAKSALLGAQRAVQPAPVESPTAVSPASDVPDLPLTVASPRLAELPTFDAARTGDRPFSSTPPRSRTAASARKNAVPAEPVTAVDGMSASPTAGAQNEATRDLALYGTAHRLHFQDRDPSRALAAWDAYLAAFPDGKLSVEAAWNRALCLIKVGRAEEAERLLERFAAGTFGGYRRTQAADLLASLRNHHVAR